MYKSIIKFMRLYVSFSNLIVNLFLKKKLQDNNIKRIFMIMKFV
jgi:hypothetical protein